MIVDGDHMLLFIGPVAPGKGVRNGGALLADAVYDARADDLHRRHVKKLILDGTASRVDHENFHALLIGLCLDRGDDNSVKYIIDRATPAQVIDWFV